MNDFENDLENIAGSKPIKKTLIAALLAGVIFVIGFAIGKINRDIQPPLINTELDTIYLDRIETITKYKTRIINETIYINNSTDSVQPDIRSNITRDIDSYLQSR